MYYWHCAESMHRGVVCSSFSLFYGWCKVRYYINLKLFHSTCDQISKKIATQKKVIHFLKLNNFYFIACNFLKMSMSNATYSSLMQKRNLISTKSHLLYSASSLTRKMYLVTNPVTHMGHGSERGAWPESGWPADQVTMGLAFFHPF